MTQKSGAQYLEEVYGAKDERALGEVYDRWAEDYDCHVQNFGYRIPGVLMGMFGRHAPSDCGPILDAGAGTGIIGEALAALNYKPVTALDLSAGMLAKARGKGVYQDYIQAALGGPLDFPDNSFGAVISGGTFTEGHAPADSFAELIRITKPGGRIVFTVLTKVYEHGGFKEKQARLEDEGRWRLLDMTPEFVSMPQESTELTNRVMAYEVI